MGRITEYIYSLMLICTAASVVTLLAPENKSRDFVNFVCAIGVTGAMLSPLLSSVSKLPEMLDNDITIESGEYGELSEVYIELLIDSAIGEIKDEIKTETEARLSVTVRDVELEVDCEDVENIIINKVIICYDEANSFVISDTVKFVGKLMACECEVVVYDDE